MSNPHKCLFCNGLGEVAAHGIPDMLFGCPRCVDGTVDDIEHQFQVVEGVMGGPE